MLPAQAWAEVEAAAARYGLAPGRWIARTVARLNFPGRSAAMRRGG